MRRYPFLEKQEFQFNGFSIVPIRDQDKFIIMKMRNDQLYHLRQTEILTKEAQENYFATAINDLFKQSKPSQVLFSFLKDNLCIGYGGLVHINWMDHHAEISFIIKPELEKEYFQISWQSFLQMLEQVAFKELNLHKIFTYAFDVRPYLYPVIESCNFTKEAVLKEHCLHQGSFIDIIIHSKMNPNASF